VNLTDSLSAVIPSVDGRVLSVLARSGLPVTGLQAATLAGASPERVRQILRRLAGDGLVSTQRAGSAVLYKANRDHLLWPAIDRLVHDADQAIWMLKGRVSTAIDDALDPADAPRVTAALFGSVARGDAGPSSDVDVLLITPDDVAGPDVEKVIEVVIDAVQKATGNECNVFAVTRSRLDELVASEDPMVPSWTADADVFHGPDFRHRLRGDPWDAQ